MKVLVVDDDPVCLRLLEGTIQKWGAEVLRARDGREALAVARESRPQLIVTDIVMPEMDGYEFCRAVRRDADLADVPVILLTALSDPHDVIGALECDADAFVTKPYDTQLLIQCMEGLVARAESPPRRSADDAIELHFGGQAYTLKPDVRRITDLLLSTYCSALQKRTELERSNQALTRAERELKGLNASLEQKVAERTGELAYSRQDIIWRLAKAAESRDEETGGHVTRVACYSQALAQELGRPESYVSDLFLTSPLHDIGKIGVPDSILRKRGRLTPEERAVMETHCTIGAEILKEDLEGAPPYLVWRRMNVATTQRAPANPILAMASRIALTHHEQWDGNGYPNKLTGDAIPLEGRIVALADAYDALSTPRTYKPAFDEDKTVAIIRKEAGARFDPDVFAAFERQIEKFRSIRTTFADETAIAEFVEQNRG